jgi:hypothetical protein
LERAAAAPPTPDLDDFLVNVYQHAQSLLPGEKADRDLLARVPLVCGTRWVRERPLFIIPDVSCGISANAADLKVWTPPCEPEAIRELTKALGVVELKPQVYVPDGGPAAEAFGENITARFQAAVAELQTDLARNQPRLYEALSSWDTLRAAALRVHEEGKLRVRISDPAWGAKFIEVAVNAYAQISPAVIHVDSVEALGDVDHGGRVVATLFAGNTRREVSLAWMAAWS